MYWGCLNLETDEALASAPAPPPGLAHWTVSGPLRLHASAAGALVRTRLPGHTADTLVLATGRLCAHPRFAVADVAIAARVLAAWQQFGPRFVEEVHGAYSCAIWCGHTQSLWLARDHMGQQPLFLARTPARLVFGSDLHGLRRTLGLQGLDPDCVRDHLLLLPPAPDRSFWRGIERLPAGRLRRYGKRGELSDARHSELAPGQTLARTEAEWVEGLRERFLQAVRDRYDPQDTGAGVSGGLDSSAVAAAAAKLHPYAPVRLYALRFPHSPESDEGRYIETFANRDGYRLSQLQPADSPLACHRRIQRVIDEPLAVQNLHLWCALYAAARSDGLAAMLDGHDGDSALGRWSSRLAARARAPWWTRLRRRLRRAAPAPSVPLGLLDAGFARSTGACERLAAAQAERERAAQDLARAHPFELCNGLPAHASECIGRIAALHGIESRHPLYDREVLRWCIAAPHALKRKDGHDRWVLRAALSGILPDSLRWRVGKTSLAAQFHRAFRQADAPRVEQLLEDREGRLAQFVDIVRVRERWQAYRSEPKDMDSAAIWAVLTLADWLEDAPAG